MLLQDGAYMDLAKSAIFRRGGMILKIHLFIN